MAPASRTASRRATSSRASPMPSMIAARAEWTARRTRPTSGPGGRPGPIRGIASTTASSVTDRAAGSALSSSERCGPTRPAAISVPITATATKFTELLIRKNATERRAIRSAGIPRRLRIQAPSASPLAPLAGTIEPTASSAPPISALARHDIRRQNTGRNISTYDTHDRSSKATASASQPGAARDSTSRTCPSPGASSAARTSAVSSASTATSRRASLRGASSSGSGVWVATASHAIARQHPPRGPHGTGPGDDRRRVRRRAAPARRRAAARALLRRHDIAALYGVSQWRELDDATVEREAGLQEFTASKLEALEERQREAAVAFLDAATELGDEHVAAEAGLALTWWRRPGSGR